MAYSPEIIEHAHMYTSLSVSFQTDMTGIRKMMAKEIIQAHLEPMLPWFLSYIYV